MTVSVSQTSNSGPLEASRPTALFTLPSGSDYDVDVAGERFLINKPVGETQTPPITVVLNWTVPKK
jgi:hypothetical protein